MTYHSEVLSIHVRKTIRTEEGLTFPIADSHVGNGRATISLHHAAILIFKDWNPNRAYSLKQGASDWAQIRPRLDENWSAGPAVFRIGCPAPIFDPAINVQNRFIVPPRISRFGCKEIPIALVTARPNHRVDAGATAQCLSHP